MHTRNNSLKYAVIGLVVILLITAGLLLIRAWEKGWGIFGGPDTEDGVVVYEGQEYVLKDGIETFLVLGLDKYEGEEGSDSHGTGVQADFLMLFAFDNNTKKCEAIHINRDTMTKVNKLSVGGTTVVESYTKQIALAYNYVNDTNDKIRCRNTKDSVEYLLNGINVDHYLSLTMDFVPAMVDMVGGVTLTVMDDFTGIDDTLVKGETVTLTGEQALTYVRTRYGLEDSTNSTRMARQQQFINLLREKVMTLADADENFLLNLIQTLDQYVAYDSSDQKMQQFAQKFEKYEFLGIREMEGESRMGEKFVEFYPDEDSIWEIVIDMFYIPKANKD